MDTSESCETTSANVCGAFWQNLSSTVSTAGARTRSESSDDALALVYSAALPRELRAALSLGYFVRGIDRDGAIEIVFAERVKESRGYIVGHAGSLSPGT
jgi:hypothetical protein